MASPKHWKIAALLIVWVVLVIVWVSLIVDNFKANEAQSK